MLALVRLEGSQAFDRCGYRTELGRSGTALESIDAALHSHYSALGCTGCGSWSALVKAEESKRLRSSVSELGDAVMVAVVDDEAKEVAAGSSRPVRTVACRLRSRAGGSWVPGQGQSRCNRSELGVGAGWSSRWSPVVV